MAYVDFPAGNAGNKARKEFWLSADGILLISQWRREGIPFEEIALKYLGVASKTLWRWTKESDDLATALEVSNDTTNAKVESALLRRALGYNYDETTVELIEGQMRTTKVVTKHVSPDVKACLSWLYSRRAERWRATQEPIDESAKELDTAKKILVAIKDAAKEQADGNSNSVEPKTN